MRGPNGALGCDFDPLPIEKRRTSVNVTDTITQARDAITVKRVFGEPYEKDGVTIVPAAWVAGGGGGGSDAEASGSGFGIMAFPVGAYVIRDGNAAWRPAINVNLVALAALFTFRAIVRARSKRRR
jgi:uncharacterized spore protein YtfJ